MGILHQSLEIYNTITLLKDLDKTYRIGKEVVFQFYACRYWYARQFVVEWKIFYGTF